MIVIINQLHLEDIPEESTSHREALILVIKLSIKNIDKHCQRKQNIKIRESLNQGHCFVTAADFKQEPKSKSLLGLLSFSEL